MVSKRGLLVVVAGVVDLSLKYWSVGGNNAVINLGVSGGWVVSDLWIVLGLAGVLYWYLREGSIGLLMVLVGGSANVISRMVWGGVPDYWSLLGLVSNNLADYLIVGGVTTYILALTRRTRTP